MKTLLLLLLTVVPLSAQSAISIGVGFTKYFGQRYFGHGYGYHSMFYGQHRPPVIVSPTPYAPHVYNSYGYTPPVVVQQPPVVIQQNPVPGAEPEYTGKCKNQKFTVNGKKREIVMCETVNGTWRKME